VTDLVVVGAGVVGLAVARAARERGASVVVLERNGISSGQSGVQPGGIRQQWGTEVATRLARESAAFYERSDETLPFSLRLGLQRCGYLFVAHSEGALARLAANVDVQRRCGVPSRVVEPAEAAELVPGLDVTTVVGGTWCPEDGYFDRPQSVVEAFAAGIDIRIAGVTALRHERGFWAVRTPTGAVEAERVVVAAGVDSKHLLAPLGVELPLEHEDRYLFLSTAVRERLLEPLVVSAERRFAAKQLADGRVLASDLGATGDAEAGAPRWRANIRSVARDLLPVLEYVDFSVLVHGRYDVTPDRQPVLGPVPGHDGLLLATGFSGHGFMIAPAVGRIVAGAALGDVPDPALAVLDLARFAEGRPVPEPQVV
jgi:sarcosine oxidase subunit beta